MVEVEIGTSYAQKLSDTRIADIDSQLTNATAAQEPLNTRIADLDGQLTNIQVSSTAQQKRIEDLERQEEIYKNAHARYKRICEDELVEVYTEEARQGRGSLFRDIKSGICFE